jgi:outer membrane lipoprotein SlyB
MKRYLFVAAIVALSAFSLAGCANQSSTATASNTDPTARTYTQKDLNKTTRTDAASALQAADPSVTTSSGSGR